MTAHFSITQRLKGIEHRIQLCNCALSELSVEDEDEAVRIADEIDSLRADHAWYMMLTVRAMVPMTYKNNEAFVRFANHYGITHDRRIYLN